MSHFVIILKAISLLQVLTSARVTVVEGNLPNISVISNFINEFVKPYIKSLDLPLNRTLGFRTGKETLVQNVIKEKILELKPFLQDNNKIIETEENLTLDGSEETTIIEFTPNAKSDKQIGRDRKDTKPDTFKADIQVYKKLREKITKALKKEPVSAKTVKLVTKTFDGLIAKFIGSQCMWKSVDHADKIFRVQKTDEDSLLKIHNVTKEEWDHFKHQYAKLTQKKFVNETLALFNKMRGFFSRIINNTMSLSKRYRVKCQLVEVKKPKKVHTFFTVKPNVLSVSNDEDECVNIEICSKELTIFMTDFYHSLNDTAVSAFRNYAAMYTRDVTTEGSFEKASFVDLINNIGNTVERKVIDIFAKETKNIKLDENKNKEANVKIVIMYLNSTTGRVKRHIKKHLEKYLKSLRARLLLNVKKDIDVNLNVDLENLSRDFISRICTVFITCNGRYLSRRAKNVLDPWGNLHVKDGKSMYVRLQLTFDEDLKNNLINNRKIRTETLNDRDKTKNQDIRYNIQEKYNKINITRTTHDATRKSFSGTATAKINSQKPVSVYGTNNEGNELFTKMKRINNVV